MTLLNFIKDALFPKYCFGCKSLGVYLCADCRKKLHAVQLDRCAYCKKASYMGLTHPLCKRKDGVDGVKSIFIYDSLTKKIIGHIKYTLVREAISEFIEAISISKREEIHDFLSLFSEPVLIPVPLHKSRQLRRGFNQSLELSVRLGKMYEVLVDDTLVKRVKKTATQAKLKSAQERIENIRDAFVMGKDSKKTQDLIIFDDVWTTGSTVKELARTLKKEGYGKVYALTMACAYT